ncbi:unnamed protein product, partial [Musa hybrid cultivar]
FLFFHGGDTGSLLILLSHLSSFLDAITRSQSSSFVACFGCAGRGRRIRVLRQHKTSNKLQKDSRIGRDMTAMKAVIDSISLSLSLSPIMAFSEMQLCLHLKICRRNALDYVR